MVTKQPRLVPIYLCYSTSYNIANCGAVSPCGRYVYVGGFVPEAKVWEVKFSKTGEFSSVQRAFELSGHSSGVVAIALNQDSSRAVTVSKDGTWRLYDTKVEAGVWEEPRFLQSSKVPSAVSSCAVALSPAGDVIALGVGTTLYLYMAYTAELDVTLDGIYETGNISKILFDDEGKCVLTCGLKHVRIFHNATGYKSAAAKAKQMLLHQKLSAGAKKRWELELDTAMAKLDSLG